MGTCDLYRHSKRTYSSHFLTKSEAFTSLLDPKSTNTQLPIPKMTIQYTALELLKFNTKQNTENAKNRPEFQRFRELVAGVLPNNEKQQGFSEVYGYFEEKSAKVVAKLEADEVKRAKNKRKNYLRRQRAKRAKAARLEGKKLEEKAVCAEKPKVEIKYKNSRLFKRGVC